MLEIGRGRYLYLHGGEWGGLRRVRDVGDAEENKALANRLVEFLVGCKDRVLDLSGGGADMVFL